MEIKRIVITGGPGSGKTTLIEHLEQNGNTVMHEISRQIIVEAQKDGIDQLFLKDAILFSDKLIKGRLNQFEKAEKLGSNTIFFDRGMPDVTAYMEYVDVRYPADFSDLCLQYRYNTIFILPPWKEIYTTDNERYESFEEAEKIFNFLKTEYEKFGYQIITVPVGNIDERIKFINENI